MKWWKTDVTSQAIYDVEQEIPDLTAEDLYVE